MIQERYLKALHKGAVAYHHFGQTKEFDCWQLPEGDVPGAWKTYGGGPLRIHFNGIHMAKLDYAICWVHDENYLAEAGGETIEDFEAVVAEKARLVRKLEISSQDAAALAIKWAQDVSILLQVMDYPEPFCQVPIATLAAFRDWAYNGKTEKPKTLQKDILQLRCQAGQYYRDAERSIGYRYSSLAARESCLAIVALDGLDMTHKKDVHNLRQAVKVAAHASAAAMFAAHGYITQTRSNGQMPDFYTQFLGQGGLLDDRLPYEVERGCRRRQSRELCQKFGL